VFPNLERKWQIHFSFCRSCHLANALVNWRGVLGATSPPIRQHLAVHALRGQHSAFLIRDPEAHAVIVAEAEFGQAALQDGL
jgi:hypothetical protein